MRAVSRHPFTCCDGIRRRPRWWISAPRYPALANALRRPTWKRGRCSSPTSATDARHAHLTDHSTPEVAASLARSSPRPMEPRPQRTTRVTTRLTTRLELQPTPSRSRRSGGCGCHPILPGSRSSRAHRWHPLSAALSSADGPNMTTFDTRVATRVRRSAARAARTAFTAASFKSDGSNDPGCLPSTSARSTYPACAKQASNANPAPIPGLCRPDPASDALSPRAPEGGGARPCRFRAFITPGRTWPRAARRLLQSKGSASTTDGPSKPRSRVGPLDFHRAPHLVAGPARRIGRPR